MRMQGKKVLVTGADGFIGSHLAERLVLEGALARVFCMYNSQGILGWLEAPAQEISTGFHVPLGDIRESRFVNQSCKDVEIVFHLATLIAALYSYIATESFVDTNICGTMNVLEGAARRPGVKRIVHSSGGEVYCTPASVPIREIHPLNVQSPYAATKIAADQLSGKKRSAWAARHATRPDLCDRRGGRIPAVGHGNGRGDGE
jgi:nucleoside-diphosphate-sugar epimerase